jgi:amidase
MDLLQLDGVGQLQALQSGQVSARELLEAVVGRADCLSAALNAVVSRDLERAHSDAQMIDDRRARGEAVGRLAGLPLTIKDTIDVEGLPASAGLAALLNRTADDAAVVRQVRGEGGVVWGKTNTPVNAADWQTYNALYGTTNNPWDPTRTPGGSSGGSAVAVATGITATEIGADIGGSLRIPASFTGVFAHKPTYGLVSQRGLVPPPGFAADLDLAVMGPMARSARDLRLLLDVISGTPVAPSTTPTELRGLKVGLWLDEPTFPLDSKVRAAIEAFAGRLAASGAVVEAIPCPVDAVELMFTYMMLLLPLTHGRGPLAERALYETLRGPALFARAMGAGPLSWAQGILGATARHGDWLKADEARARMARQVATAFDRHDVIVAPVAPITAFPHDHSSFVQRKLSCSDGRRIGYLEMMKWVALATVFGLPATAVPIGLSAQGLPVGIQIIGPSGQDARTLAVAEAIDGRIGGFQPPRAVSRK